MPFDCSLFNSNDSLSVRFVLLSSGGVRHVLRDSVWGVCRRHSAERQVRNLPAPTVQYLIHNMCTFLFYFSLKASGHLKCLFYSLFFLNELYIHI